jgi:hypothetical protein
VGTLRNPLESGDCQVDSGPGRDRGISFVNPPVSLLKCWTGSGAGWQIPGVAARDPSLRPYRAGAWVLYFTAISVAVGLFVSGVVRNLRGRPRRAPVTAATGNLPTRASLRVCMDDLDAMYQEQNQRAWALGTHFEGVDPLRSWTDWAPRWEDQLNDLADRCRLDASSGDWARERAEMAAARDAMLALHRAYTAQVNRFAEEMGDLARAAAEAVHHARDAARGTR